MSENLEKRHMYHTPSSPTFTLQLSSGDVHAKDGILHLDDEQEAELDRLVNKHNRHDIASNVRKIDTSAAEVLVKEHQAKIKPDATAGTLTSAQAKPAPNDTALRNVDVKTPAGASESLMARLKGNSDQLKAAEIKPEVSEERAFHDADLTPKEGNQ